jgi:hypothetical protein
LVASLAFVPGNLVAYTVALPALAAMEYHPFFTVVVDLAVLA